MDEGVYRICGLENGAFSIDEDGMIIIHGDDEAVIKFDKKDKSDFINILMKLKKSK